MVINIATYHQFIENPLSVSGKQLIEIKNILDTYPYFQSLRALYLKALKNIDSFTYNNQLKVTAAYTVDRVILFDFITSFTFKNQQTIHNKKPVESPEIENPVPQTQAEVALEIGKPIGFTINEKHSFNQWLQIATVKPIQREKNDNQKEIKQSIIDKFIEANPKITPLEKNKEVGLSISKNKVDNSLMTETLAKVYLEQKKYVKAIKAYEILSLKYPEKSSFFADQIRRIKILKQKTS